jgi:hypothetical protein
VAEQLLAEAADPVTVYICIGNADDQLTQRRWAEFAWNIHSELEGRGQLHGEWASDPVGEFQNACWCITFPDGHVATMIRALVACVARQFSQTVAWAVARTDFI